MLTAREYKENLQNFGTFDGVKAIILYGIYMLVLFVQGLIYTTNFSVWILNGLQVILPLFLLIIVILFIALAKEKISTVGLSGKKIFSSLLWGALLAIAFIMGIVIYFLTIEKKAIAITTPTLSTLGIFIIGAMQEEIIFRGYIQTRLTGITKQTAISSLCTAFLFLLIHYPIRWVVGGFSLTALSLYYVITLIILHFLCAFVYQRTNCLWGAIALHFLYNVGQSMLAL